MRSLSILVLFSWLITGSAVFAKAPPTNRSLTQAEIASIEQITGLKGSANEEERTCKVSFPRTEIKVAVDAWQMPPFMGLTSWATFSHGRKNSYMVMGDTVLFQDEVNPVMSVFLESGIEVTALHNHFFYDDPKVYFMHIAGEGSLEALAGAIKKGLDKVREIRGASDTVAKGFGGSVPPEKSSISQKAIEDVFGLKAAAQNGMVKIVIGRTATMACDCSAGKEMGVNTWAAFAGSDENALVDGDFAVREKELQAVLKSLRKSGINVVAIHHHMSEEKPRILFIHYWGKGSARSLATSVKAAVDLTAHQ